MAEIDSFNIEVNTNKQLLSSEREKSFVFHQYI